MRESSTLLRDLIKTLHRAGFVAVRSKGSHYVYRHHTVPGTTVRISHGHRHVDSNELVVARRAMERAAQGSITDETSRP